MVKKTNVFLERIKWHFFIIQGIVFPFLSMINEDLHNNFFKRVCSKGHVMYWCGGWHCPNCLEEEIMGTRSSGVIIGESDA